MTARLSPEHEAECAARVERYAKGTYERLNPGFRWEDAPADDRASYTEPVKAAIAVADEEMAVLRAKLAEARGVGAKRVSEWGVQLAGANYVAAHYQVGEAVADVADLRRHEKPAVLLHRTVTTSPWVPCTRPGACTCVAEGGAA